MLEEAKDGFELKAAEIVSDAEHALATRNKISALSTLFPRKLPEAFEKAFEPGFAGQYNGLRVDGMLDLFSGG